jgi:hypothetical protein
MLLTYGHVEVGVAAGPVGDAREGVGHQHVLQPVTLSFTRTISRESIGASSGVDS